jgi:uncharacterized protein (DUF58 family)
MAASDRLLDPEFLRKLELLRIVARRAFPGVTRGERRSTRRGASVEFADFRKYEAGDDFRHIDWNIYARLERLMLRQFVEEEDVRIDVLIDMSESMRFGEPVSKFDYARRVAATISFLAIESHDRVGVASFDSRMGSRVRALRGQTHLKTVVSYLESLGDAARTEGRVDTRSRAEGRATDLAAVLRGFRRAYARPGILFVISDFLDAGEFRRELKLIAQARFDINLLQILSPAEQRPELTGDLLLVDSETGRQVEVTTDGRTMRAYRVALDDLTRGLQDFCRSAGISYTLVSTAIGFEDVLLSRLAESGMVR